MCLGGSGRCGRDGGKTKTHARARIHTHTRTHAYAQHTHTHFHETTLGPDDDQRVCQNPNHHEQKSGAHTECGGLWAWGTLCTAPRGTGYHRNKTVSSSHLHIMVQGRPVYGAVGSESCVCARAYMCVCANVGAVFLAQARSRRWVGGGLCTCANVRLAWVSVCRCVRICAYAHEHACTCMRTKRLTFLAIGLGPRLRLHTSSCTMGFVVGDVAERRPRRSPTGVRFG